MTTPPAVEGPTGPGPIRVLVVDDQELVRSGFCVILDTADGIVVVGEAANGEAALAAAYAHHPDVVLMDIRMPGTDGLTATRQIAADPHLADVHVVILTTFELDEYVYVTVGPEVGANNGAKHGQTPDMIAMAEGRECLVINAELGFHSSLPSSHYAV